MQMKYVTLYNYNSYKTDPKCVYYYMLKRYITSQ